MKKIISVLFLLLIFSFVTGTGNVFADNGINGIIDGMSNASTLTSVNAGSGIGQTINNVIGLLQLAGTGISVIVDNVRYKIFNCKPI